MTPDNVVRLVITVIVLYFWTDNLLRAYRNWSGYRDSRSFRAFLIGFMVELGALAYVFNAIGRIVPEVSAVAGLFALAVTGALLVVGAFTFVSWRRKP